MSKSSVFFRTPFNHDPNEFSDSFGLRCDDVSLAVQSERDECDINVLVERFGVTGSFPVPAYLPTFQDFEGIFDYQSAQNALIEAEKSFLALPARIRERFNNTPHRFVEFCSDPSNLEELYDLGLAIRPVSGASVEDAKTTDKTSDSA